MSLVILLPGTTTEDIAAAVRDALATELARLDVAVSTRSTAADFVCPEPPPRLGGDLT